MVNRFNDETYRREAHKQALSDEELQGKIQDEIGKRQAIIEKLPTLQGPERDKATSDLTEIAHNLRELYHPEKNPGAIEKLGHLLTDHLGLTNALGRDQKSVAKKAQGWEKDQSTAQGWEASAPLSPEQQAQVEARKKNAENDATIEWLRKNGASEDVINSYKEHVAGVPLTRGTKAVGIPYQDANDKKWYQRYLNNDGTDYRVEVPGYTPKESGTGPIRAWKQDDNGKIFSVLLDRQTNKPIPGTENYDILPPPYLTGKITTGVFHWVDEDHNEHETPEERTTSPVLPGSPTPSPTSTPTPKKTTGAGGQSAPPTAGGKKGDTILGKGKNPAFDKLATETNEDQRIVNDADTWIKIPKGQRSAADYSFVIKLIHSNAGRVNILEINAMFGLGGLKIWPDAEYAKRLRGELPDQTRNQLWKLVHDQLDADKKTIAQMNSSGTSPQNGGETQPTGSMSDEEFLEKIKVH